MNGEENFNSRAHVERDASDSTAEVSIENFNSRAHVERDRNVPNVHGHFAISTHALTWSATRKRR